MAGVALDSGTVGSRGQNTTALPETRISKLLIVVTPASTIHYLSAHDISRIQDGGASTSSLERYMCVLLSVVYWLTVNRRSGLISVDKKRPRGEPRGLLNLTDYDWLTAGTPAGSRARSASDPGHQAE